MISVAAILLFSFLIIFYEGRCNHFGFEPRTFRPASRFRSKVGKGKTSRTKSTYLIVKALGMDSNDKKAASVSGRSCLPKRRSEAGDTTGRSPATVFLSVPLSSFFPLSLSSSLSLPFGFSFYFYF